MLRRISDISLRRYSFRLFVRTLNGNSQTTTAEKSVSMPFGNHHLQQQRPLRRAWHNTAYVRAVNKVMTKSTTAPTLSDVGALYTAIETQCNRNGYVNYEHLTKLLNLIETDSFDQEQLTAKQIKFLLEASGTLLTALNAKQRIEVCERLWRHLHKQSQQSNDALTTEFYRVYLEALYHNRCEIPRVEELLQALATKYDGQASGANNSSNELLSLMLSVACAAGNMRQAATVLAAIRSKNFPLTEHNFAALLMGNALNGDAASILSGQESMIAAGLNITSVTQSLLICGYLGHGETAKALEILKRHHRQFDGAQVLEMLRAATLHAHTQTQENSTTTNTMDEVITQLIQELPTDYTSGTEMIAAIRNICVELIYQKDLSKVKTILKALPAPSFNDNQDVDTFGVGVLREMFRAQLPIDEIIGCAQLLIECGKNTRALHVIAEVALRRYAPMALPVFKALVQQQQQEPRHEKKENKEEVGAETMPLRAHYFWPLFLHNFRHHGEAGIVRTLKLMNDFQIECDESTLQQYVLSRLSIILDDPQQCVKQLSEVGVSPAQILVPVVKHLLNQQKISEALRLLELYPTRVNLSELLTPMANLIVNTRSTRRYYHYAKLMQHLMAKSNDGDGSGGAKFDFLGEVLVEAFNSQERLRQDANACHRLIRELHKCNLPLSHGACDCIVSAIKDLAWDTKIRDQTIELLEKMRSRQLNFNAHATAKEKHSGGGNNDSSTFIKHPRNMTSDELECHLIELEAKQLNTRGVLRRLLQVSVRDGRLERALAIKKRCDELKVLVSPGMMASIFDLYIKLKDLPQAQSTLKRLQTDFPGFQLDEHKLIDYCTLLIQNHEIDAAKQLLQARSSTQRIQGGDYVIKNVWNLLNSIAAIAAQSDLPKESNMTSEMFQLVQRLGYCKHANAVLGPIVRERLLRGQLEMAVEEFVQLADRYKCTPLQYELLSLLISHSNNSNSSDNDDGSKRENPVEQISIEKAQELLAKVCDTITQVHGVQNLNSALLLAFAESGTDGQLRRLFINPEFRINQDLLIKNCENLDQKGAVRTLLRLARNARGVGHIIDEQRIYNMILQNCAQRNDYVAALDLYERLCADDELKISQDFLRELVKLLRINKQEVPVSIALRAQSSVMN